MGFPGSWQQAVVVGIRYKLPKMPLPFTFERQTLRPSLQLTGQVRTVKHTCDVLQAAAASPPGQSYPPLDLPKLYA